MDFVHIEPGDGQRGHFALWCLAQDPQIQTASASGFNVPLVLYPGIPAELLEGAYVDGYPHGGIGAPQPVPQAVDVPVAPQNGGTSEVELTPRGGMPDLPRKPRARRTASRPLGKASDQKIDTDAVTLLVADTGGAE